MFGIGTSELMIILLVVLLLFGSKELPELARTLGKGWRDLQRVARSTKEEISSILDEDEDKDELMG